MKFRRILRLFVLSAGLITLIAGVVVALNARWTRVETIRIELAKLSSEDLLFQRIKGSLQPQLGAFEGLYFWQVRLRSVFESVAKDKRVRKVAVYREFPSVLRVEIEPHTPVLGFLSGDGRIYPVATDATLLPALPVKDAQDLPLLRGDDLRDEPRLREVALELFDKIPTDGEFRKRDVSEILYTKKDGFDIFLSDVESQVRMGDADFGPKISRVQKVLSYLESQNIKGRVIDARFNKKVVVRVRKAP